MGTERSGSNLLRLILNAHSRIAVPHPPHVLRYFAPLEAGYGDLSRRGNRARLVDDVLPAEDLRQGVFTFPQPLPKLLAWRPDLLTVLLRDIASVLQRDLQRRTGQPTGRTGMVSLIQTFAGDLRLFVHVHALVLDGVYVEDGGGLRFVEAPVPTQQDITKVAQEVAARVQRSCARWRRRPGRRRDAGVARSPCDPRCRGRKRSGSRRGSGRAGGRRRAGER